VLRTCLATAVRSLPASKIRVEILAEPF